MKPAMTYPYAGLPRRGSYQFLDRYGKRCGLPKGAEVKPRVGVFGITTDSRGHLLVTSPPHALDMPGLPGGGREGIETHAQALQREFFEETGPYFVLKGKSRPVHQQQILYFASDKNEYWRYEQYFYLVNIHHPRMPTTSWSTPEGGRAAWIPLREYRGITASHKLALEAYLKENPGSGAKINPVKHAILKRTGRF